MPSAWWRTFCNRRTRRSSGAYTALRGAFLYGLLTAALSSSPVQAIVAFEASALERAGITAHILRSPKMISGEGCSHSVKVSERNLAPALLILGRVGLTPKRIYIMSSDGSYKEVLL